MVRARFQLSLLALGIQIGGAALQVLHNLFGHQMAVLVAALVRLAFDVEINPSSRGIAIGRTKRCHRGARRPIVFGRNFIDADARKPSLPVESSALAGVSRMLSCALVAVKRRWTRVQSCVPPTDSECTSNGMDAMVSAAPMAMGERSRSRTASLSVRTQPDSS